MTVTYKVLAPCVILRNEEGVRREAYQGAEVEGLLPEQVDHLLGLGFIAKVGTQDAAIVPGTEFLVPESIHAPEFDAATAHEVPEPPAKVAPKADWVAYAVVRGADEAEAESLTKPELIELYG